MNLHNHKKEFDQLVTLTSVFRHIPETAVRQDYYSVMILQCLSASDFRSLCVFKGGTSLSKCYPGSIDRFSEDIDLTYIPPEKDNSKKCERELKILEQTLAAGFIFEPIPRERTERNKSCFLISKNDNCRIKLEIGSQVRPEPFKEMTLKTYIQEYLEKFGMNLEIERFELSEIRVNALDITRTFVDKLMAVKGHALCGNLHRKVRHIYDVVRLYQTNEIREFLANKKELKAVVLLTKKSDGDFLQKRCIPAGFDPLAKYDFLSWQVLFNEDIQKRYETLHEDLLYTHEKQDFAFAKKTFLDIDDILRSIDE